MRAESARTMRNERREAYLQLLYAVSDRISALARLREEPDSMQRHEDAEAARAQMWRSRRSVRLAGPGDATKAAEALVRHYDVVDANNYPAHGGSALEGRFVEIAKRDLASDDASGASSLPDVSNQHAQPRL